MKFLLCLVLLSFTLSAMTQETPPVAALFPPPARPVAALAPLVQPQSIYSYARMLTDAQRLSEAYPGLVQVSEIGRSVFGRRLLAIRLGRGPVEITMNGAHHGREWMTSALLMAMIDRYALAYYRGESFDGFDVYNLLNRVSIWVVPMVNPDGVSLSQSGASSSPDARQVIALNDGRLAFAAWKANGNGVDLNRQYPARWESIHAPASRPGPENYRGPAPLSEPETRAVAAFIRQHDFALHLALHSAGEIVFWHFYQTGLLHARSARIAHRIGALTGYALVPPSSYESGGGYKDWVVQALGVPGFTVEVGKPTRRGPITLAQYPAIWARVQALGLLLAQEVVEPGTQGGSVRGYLDGRLVARADAVQPLGETLLWRVRNGEGVRAEIYRQGQSRPVWRYPEQPFYRIVIAGKTRDVYSNLDVARAAFHRALEEPGASGFLLTDARRLIAAAGHGLARAATIAPNGAVQIDSTILTLPERPCERDGRLYAPAELLGAMHATVMQDDGQCLTLTRGDTRLLLIRGSALALLNDAPYRLDAPVYATPRATMVPLRSVVQAFGAVLTVEPAGAIALRWHEERADEKTPLTQENGGE